MTREVDVRERVVVPMLCLECGSVRTASGRVDAEFYYGVEVRSHRLKCVRCGQTQSHAPVWVGERYGAAEDEARFRCAEVAHLVRRIQDLPYVDVRWSPADWCLGDAANFDTSLVSVVRDGLRMVDQLCEDCAAGGTGRNCWGARPAGILVRDGDRLIVDIDERQPLDRLLVPLQNLWRTLAAGESVESGYLSRAYAW
jgi:hypothetical protein